MTLLLILFLLAGAAFAQTTLPPGGGTPPAGATYVNTFEGRSGTVTGAEGDYDLTELGDVLLTTPADLDCLRYDLASGNWTNRPAAQCGGGGGGAPTDSTYITQTPDAGLSAEQALSALATGILKSTTGTGVITIAVAGDIPDLSSLYLTDASAGACTNQFVRAVGDDTGPTCATVATTDAAAVFLVEADVGNGLQVIANTLSVQPLDATITVAAGGIDVGADQVGPTEIDETANYTLTGQHDFTGAELLGGSPLRLEGTTDDNTYTTVLVTDPTGARSFTLPDADSVAIQPSDCGGGNFVRTVSALGVISCASDQTGGSGLSNYAKAVNAAATLTILGSEHNFGHNNIIEPTCYDNSTPAVPWLVGNWTVHPSTFDVVINWVGNKTGECVINGSGGAGTVTSVAVTAPSILSVGGSPITAAGTIALTLATQADNTVFAGPNGGGPLAPTFRLLVEADISDLAHTTVGADHIDALTEIAQGIKTAANDSDPLAVFTGGNPAGTRCVEITSGGQMQAAGDTCANLGPAGATAIEDLGDAAGAGTVAVAEFPQVWDWNSAATAAAVDGLTLNYTLDASTDATAQRILRLVRPEAANTGTLDVALSIENLDTAAQLSVAIQVRSEAGTIGTALDANDADITNVIQFTTGALSHSDLELLDDGAIDLASEVSGVAPDANVANDITLDNLTQITTRNFSAMQGTVGDTQIAAGAVDGGNLGEIADGSVTTDDLGTDSVSADELNASGVQAELEAVLVLANLQGDLLPARVDDGGVAATFALFSGAGGSAAFRALVEADISDLAHTTVAADHIDAMTELATGIKSRADDVDTKIVTTSVAPPAGLRCMQMDTNGSVTLGADTCANLGPGGTPSFDVITAGSNGNALAMASGGTFLAEQGSEVESNRSIMWSIKASVGTITAGQVVYIAGYNPGLDIASVELADADNASAMPAVGVALENITNVAAGRVAVSGRLQSLNTSSFSAGDEVFVSTTAGALVNAAPTGATSAIQKVGLVVRSHATLGVIDVIGAGRSNAVPNLAATNFWLGNASGVAVAVAMSGDASMDNAGAVTVLTGDSATNFFPAGTIEHERGGLEADVAAYSGLVGINSGVTSEVDTEAELETHLGGLDVMTVTTDDFTSANLADALTNESGTGVFILVAAGSSTVGQIPRVTGANAYAFGALDLADSDAITGIIPEANLPVKEKTVVIQDPDDYQANENGKVHFAFAAAQTITRVWCSTDTGTATCNLEERAETTPDTAGTDVLSSDLVCDTGSQSSCASGCDVNTITNGAVDARDPLSIVCSASSSSGWMRFHVEY